MQSWWHRAGGEEGGGEWIGDVMFPVKALLALHMKPMREAPSAVWSRELHTLCSDTADSLQLPARQPDGTATSCNDAEAG